ncbi:MAG: serine/threonine-protein kinase PknK, partial [bacterium]|nr:serine/threonine-protein kinase PknK [bacterium]
MLHVPGYHVTGKLYESANSFIYRGIRSNDEHPLILKILRAEFPTPTQVIQFNNEYAFTKDLHITGIRRALQATKVEHKPALILDYVGGETLNAIAVKRVSDVLIVAIRIARILGDIHHRQIIHKDINPSNILVSSHGEDDWQVTLIDFGISSKITLKMPHLGNPDRLEGTLAYMSPEQTGRMNRVVDYRTDFYSLGVTLYELLTGRLPFEAEDAMELVHCHLAKMPVPPCEIPHPSPLPKGEGVCLPSPFRRGAGDEVPEILSDIVMKLLAKNAEDRYQSAFGLQYDLERCLKHLTDLEELSSVAFELAQHDASGRFQIPQHLYGRKQELDTLLQAFQRVSAGTAELMLVAGYSGVGKTALVHEVHKPITEKRGYFVSGKFDQYQRNIPYTAFSQVLNELCRYLLAESEEQLASWRNLILKAVGNNGQVLLDIIPALELIVGPQPAVTQAGPVEAQNRLHLVFQNFICALSRAEHPLVVFIDDWQWADAASLELLQTLITNPDNHYFLLIGAYRENEVDASHPFVMTLEEIEKAQAIITTLHVPHLSPPNVNALIADSLACQPGQVQTLTDLVYDKTRGNAFFVHQFLKSLYEQEFLVFEHPPQSHLKGGSQGRWQWNVERIAAQGMTDNVVELLAGKIDQLPEASHRVLPLAACIGSQCTLNTLSIIYQHAPQETFAHLWPAIAEGLLLPLDDRYKLLGSQDEQAISSRFTFRHDRIQQAAYSLIVEADRQAIHLQIGRVLLTNTEESKVEGRLFDIVNQFNQGLSLITEPAEKLRLAELNLRAGRKAKMSTAYHPALEYFRTGTELLPEGSWEHRHALTFGLHREWYECEYLTAHFDEAEALLTHMLSHTASNLEQAEIYSIGIVQHTMLSRNEEALEMGRDALELFGIELPERGVQTAAERELENVRFNLGERRIADLVDLPMMTNPEKQKAVKLLMNLVPPSYVTRDLALFSFVMAKAINIAVKYGNTPEMPFGYGIYGVILRTLFQEYHMGDEFGKLAIRLSEKRNDAGQKCRAFFIAANYLNHWRMPVASSVPLARQAFQYGLESGELQFAGYAFNTLLRALAIKGEELGTLRQQVEHAQQFANKTKNMYLRDSCTLWQQFIHNLQGQTDNTKTLNDRSFVEQQFLDGVGRVSSIGGNFYTLKLQILYLYGHYADARRMLTEAEQSFAFTLCSASVIDHNFYSSLTISALYPLADADTQGTYREQLSANQQQMERWAEDCPENFLHK